jgi:ABC-type glycerol-3-phosphate transport system permease component
MKNSVIICSLATLAVVAISLPCAYGFSRLNTKTSHRLYLAYFILRMLPPIALLVPWYFILNSLGLIDTYGGLSFIYFIFQLPVGIWLMKGFFDTIPVELEEYTWIEGAGVFRAFARIIVPLAGNGISVTAVFVFIYCYIEFMYASIFSRTDAIPLPPYIAGFSTPWEIRFQLMLAAALVSIIPMVLLFLFVQRYMVKGITGGALKY